MQYLSTNYDRTKTLENVECFKYLGSILTNMEDVRVKLNPGLLW